jgi:hypothetical protein
MKYAIGMGSVAKIYIHKMMRGYTDTQTAW